MTNENEKYLITGVEDGWIKVDKATWDYYQYLKTKERMEIEQKLANAKFALWRQAMKNEKMWENISLQETIKMAFPREWDKIKYWGQKPQAYTLEKALETLQTMLATQDINLMIDWAYGKYSLPPPANTNNNDGFSIWRGFPFSRFKKRFGEGFVEHKPIY